MFEPTQKGNPYQITKNQHCHTAYCIGLFENNGFVQVKRLATNDVIKCKRDNQIFCAKRVWDERAEKGYMAKIENDFHREVDNADLGVNRNHTVISMYHLLWYIRYHFYVNPLSDANLVGEFGSGITKDQSEVVEGKWGAFVRKNGELPSRFLTSLKIQQLIDMNVETYSAINWGLLKATEGEFLVSDCYRGVCFMPITPKLAFYANEKDQEITRDDLAALNNLSKGQAFNFYFGKDLTACFLS
jgi:hypothetical protein